MRRVAPHRDGRLCPGQVASVTCAVIVSAFFSTTALAQDFGVKGGVDLTKAVASDGAISSTARPGFVAGVVVVFQLPGPLAWSVEGLVSQQRTRVENVVTDTLTYVEVPALVRYDVPGSQSHPIAISGGVVVVRRLLRAQELIGGASSDVFDALEANDVGVAVSGDVQITRKLAASVRYVYGVSDIYKGFGGGAFGRHRTIQAGATYWFNR